MWRDFRVELSVRVLRVVCFAEGVIVGSSIIF